MKERQRERERKTDRERERETERERERERERETERERISAWVIRDNNLLATDTAGWAHTAPPPCFRRGLESAAAMLKERVSEGKIGRASCRERV